MRLDTTTWICFPAIMAGALTIHDTNELCRHIVSNVLAPSMSLGTGVLGTVASDGSWSISQEFAQASVESVKTVNSTGRTQSPSRETLLILVRFDSKTESSPTISPAHPETMISLRRKSPMALLISVVRFG